MPTAEEYRQLKAEKYRRAKEQGLCYQCVEDTPAADGATLCPQHWADARAANAAYARKMRKRRLENGLCPHCGKPRPKYTKSCLACRIKRGRVLQDQKARIAKADDREARIAAATKLGDDGRTRYHGQQKRGSQPKVQLDQQDAADAKKQIDRGLEGLLLFESDEVKAAGRIQRDGVLTAALHELNLASGHIDDILDRRGFFRESHVIRRHARKDEG